MAVLPRRQKAANQQYLTQQEEKALVSYLLRMSMLQYTPIKELVGSWLTPDRYQGRSTRV